ncbi:MAG: D-alanine--D-alanine ligase [Bacteroidota bacterium]
MKKNIALVAGGDSGEYIISVNSAEVIRKNIDARLYNVFLLMVKGKEWIYRDEEGSERPVDKDDFSVLHKGEKIHFDCALITIHGTPGEDGKLQGYLDMMGIPYTTSGQLACSITFNKHFCNALAAHWGMTVARSAKFAVGSPITAEHILEKVNLPVFVKPNKGGSSLGTTFVKDVSELMPAIQSCLEHDDEAFVEEFIEGIELTCGVYRRQGEIFVLPVTEIVSKTEAKFFDYKAKYTKGAADEITPARVSPEATRRVQEATAFLYKKFELRGVCRLDFILKQDKLFFLEANITPGMSERSIVPQQAEYIGISLQELFTDVIEEAMKSSKTG